MADYVKKLWVDDDGSGLVGTPVDAANMNHAETQYDKAKAEYQADAWGAPPTVPVANVVGRITLTQMKDALTDKFLKSQGIGSDPIYSLLAAADIPVHDFSKVSTGIVPVIQGGTGLATIALGGILYASGADTFSRIAPAGANMVLRSTGANALQFAALDPADIPNLAATILTSGSIDGDRLPAMSQTKKGGVPLTGVPSGLFLRDDATWAAAAGGGGGDVSSIDAVAVDNQIVRENLTTGKSIQKSLATIDDAGTIDLPAGQAFHVGGAQHVHAGADITSGRIALARMTDAAVALYLRGMGAAADPEYTSIPFTDLAAGQHTLAQEPRGTAGQFIKGAGVGSDPIYAALTSADWTGRITLAQTMGGADDLFLVGTGAAASPEYRAFALTDLPTVTPAKGGTGQTTVPAKGDLLAGGGSIMNLLAVGTDGQVVTADAASAYGVKWNTPATGGTPSSADYVIYVSGGVYYAIDGLTGAVAFSNAVFLTLMASVFGANPCPVLHFRAGTFVIANSTGWVIEGGASRDTQIWGAGRGKTIFQASAACATGVTATRSFGVVMRDCTIDANNKAGTIGLCCGDICGVLAGNVGYEQRFDDVEIKNCTSHGIQLDDQTYYMKFNNLRVTDGILGYAVHFNDAAGAAGDNGQTIFTGCRLSGGLGGVHRTAVSATRHRIEFVGGGIQAGSSANYVLDLLGMHNTGVFGTDIETNGTGPITAMIRLGGYGQQLYNVNISPNGFSKNCVVGDSAFGWSGIALIGCRAENLPAGSYFWNDTESLTLIANTIGASAGTLYGANVSANSVIMQAAIDGVKVPYLASATGSPPALTANGQICTWRDTTANLSYLCAYINGAFCKVVMA